MADSLLRLRVESNEYDSKIKRAQQGLLHFEDACRKAGKSMNDMEKDQKQFVQSLGSMQTVSTSVRGKIGELSSAFVELRSQYNRLTDEEKKGDFGRALSGSLEQLKTRVQAAKAELKDIQKELDSSGSAGGGGFLSGMGDKMGGALQVFAGNMMTKAAGAVANLGSEMAAMVQQGVELARQGEGIRIAFERLGRGDILDGLREATHGTVTDLELMKFNDFKLPLEELGTMLAFAQQKAKDTGQSVDYMVDSIVTGLGRKSLMILDNLGLSASEINERMAETGDMTKAVGAIIREQMAKAGDYVETAADRATKANVEMQNKLEELGRTFAPIQEAGAGMFNRLKMAAIDALNGMRPFFDQFTEAGRIRQQKENRGGNDKVNEQLNKLKVARAAGSDYYVQSSYNSTIKDYEKQISDLSFKIAAFGKGRDAMEKGHIRQLKEQKEAVVQLMNEYKAGAKQYLQPVKAVIDTSEAEQDITSLTKKLKDLQEQRKKAIAAGDTELSKNLAQQITQTKADIKGLGGSVPTFTTHTVTPQERSTEKYDQAQKDYQQAVEQAALEMRAGTITQVDARRKELQAQESLWKAIGDAREIYDTPELEAAQKKAADEVVRLGGEVKSLADAEAQAKEATRQLESAQKKLADAQQKLADAQATGSATAVYKAQKDVDRQQDVVNRLQNPSLPVPAQPTGFEAYKQSVQAEIKFDQMQVDENTLHTLLKTAIEKGLNTEGMDFAGLREQIGRGLDIPDEKFQELQAKINEQLQAMGFDPINIDFKTGNIKEAKKLKEDGDSVATSWNNASKAVGSIGSALQTIEDPTAKVAGLVAQAVAQIAATFAASLKGTFTPWDWIAAAAAGTATMVSTIATIKSSTKGGFAEGGIVPGNSFSGDNLRISDYGINSGELILSRSQQDSIAAQLTNDDVQASGGVPYVTGETLFLGVSNTLRRQGKGEIVTTSMLRRAGIRL